MKNGQISVFLALLILGFFLMSGCMSTGSTSASLPATAQPTVTDTLHGNPADLSQSLISSKPDARITDKQITGDKVDVTVEFTNPTADTLVMALDLICYYNFTGNDGSNGASTATAQASKTVPPNGRMKTSVQMTLPVDTGNTLVSSSIKISPSGLMNRPE